MDISERKRIYAHSLHDLWEPYRGKYPDPTPAEYGMIRDYVSKFDFEDDDFVEDNDQRWISLKNNFRCSNMRHLLTKFLRQVRETKGYDVDDGMDLYLDFFRSSTVFIRRSLDDKKFYNEAMAATKFAIRKINAQMKMGGKTTYELVSVDKFVSAVSSHSYYNLLLLTFSANEININANAVVVTFQAMVRAKEIDGHPLTFKLKQWKFKPIPIHLSS